MARQLTARTALWRARGLLGKLATASVERCYAYEARGPSGRQYLSCDGVHELPCSMGRPVYRVGKIVLGMFNEIVGQGNTWEEALAAAGGLTWTRY